MNKPAPLILMIEDDHEVGAAVSELLEMNGYRTSIARNGLEALSFLKNHSELPKLIITDLIMPIMDGLEFRERQLLLPEISHIPVIFTSGSLYAEPKIKQLGCVLFQKPYDLDKFEQTIGALIR